MIKEHDDWIKHDGGDMPVRGDTIVQVRFRGITYHASKMYPAKDFYWNTPMITHYRIGQSKVAHETVLKIESLIRNGSSTHSVLCAISEYKRG